MPTPVYEEGDVTVLWNQAVHTDREVTANRPDIIINPLTPNDPYSGRTAPLTSKSCILCSYSTNIGTEYFKHGIYSTMYRTL